MAVAFTNLGKHCEFVGCAQLDFLPFQCNACKKTFCLEHRTYQAHRCSEADLQSNIAPQCPLCGQTLVVEPGEDLNARVDRHISQGCTPEQKPSSTNACSHRGCKNREFVPIICKDCGNNYCFAHRLPQDHHCSPRSAPTGSTVSAEHQAKRQARIQAQMEILRKQRAKSTGNQKLDLMRMKMKAVGPPNLPPEKRFYLEVVFPMDSKVTPKNMYFRIDNSVGQVIDQICKAGMITNRNHEPGAPKLILFNLRTGESLSPDSQLNELAATGQLLSGECVLLERVDTPSE